MEHIKLHICGKFPEPCPVPWIGWLVVCLYPAFDIPRVVLMLKGRGIGFDYLASHSYSLAGNGCQRCWYSIVAGSCIEVECDSLFHRAHVDFVLQEVE